MALTTESRTLHGFDVACTQLPVRKQLALMAKIGRIIGPVIASGGVKMDADVSSLAPAIVQLFASLDDGAIVGLVTELLASTTIIMPITIDERTKMQVVELSDSASIDFAFNGNLMLMLECAKFAIEVNYKGFFAAIGLFTKGALASA